MKKLIAALTVSFALIFGAQAQTNTPPATNIVGTVGVGEFLGTAWNTMIGQGLTNLSATIYGDYTPSLKKWGYGLVVMRNLNIGGGFGVGLGAGIDEYDSQFYGLTAQATLNAATTPFAGWGTWGKSIVVTPFGGLALGTPFGSSTSGTSGNLETIEFVGANVHLFKALGAEWGVTGIYGTRTGLGTASGTFYGGGLSAIWKF